MTETTAATGATYERVTYRPEGGRARTIYLHRPTVSGIFLTGIEVDKEGDEVAPKGVDERLHMIELALVVERVPMEMHRIYGELVERTVPTGQKDRR